MKFHFYLLLSMILFTSVTAKACTCYGLSYFCDAVSFSMQYFPENTLVIRAIKANEIKVNEYQTDAIFNIIESFINPKRLSSIRIIDGNGANCQQSIAHYPKGTELIIHAYLSEDSETGNLSGSISACEPQPLEVAQGRVRGEISSGVTNLSLSRFRELTDCSISAHVFKVLNMPDQQKIAIDLFGSPDGHGNLLIYDISGRKLLRHPFLFERERQLIEFSTQALPPGIYILQLVSPSGTTTRRFPVS